MPVGKYDNICIYADMKIWECANIKLSNVPICTYASDIYIHVCAYIIACRSEHRCIHSNMKIRQHECENMIMNICKYEEMIIYTICTHVHMKYANMHMRKFTNIHIHANMTIFVYVPI